MIVEETRYAARCTGCQETLDFEESFADAEDEAGEHGWTYQPCGDYYCEDCDVARRDLEDSRLDYDFVWTGRFHKEASWKCWLAHDRVLVEPDIQALAMAVGEALSDEIACKG